MEPLIDEWIRALALHADVEIIAEAFDLGHVCDRVRPDFIIYEGLSTLRPRPVHIRSPFSHPEIPRAIFLNLDPHDPMRIHIHRMIEALRIEAIFTYDTDHEEHMPELAGMTFSVPILIDPAIHRDHGLEKSIPVSVFGYPNEPKFYAWRTSIVPALQARFPVFIHAHPGYRRQPRHPFAVDGLSYARHLNRSWFALADGTRLDYIVRKHLEIPACGAVLVAPDSAALADYGLVDMVNCITGSGSTLLDKIATVAEDEALYALIRTTGMRHVAERFTPSNWCVITEWAACRSGARAGESVRQHGLFGGFEQLAPNASATGGRPAPIRANAVTRVLLAAREALEGDTPADQLALIEEALREVASWLGHLMEPWIPIGVIRLLHGDTDGARVSFLRASAIQFTRHEPHIADEAERVCLDPVETSWLLLLATLRDDLGLARMALGGANGVRHLALRRIFWLLDDAEAESAFPVARLPGDRPSVHWLGQESPDAWYRLMRRIFRACGTAMPHALTKRQPAEFAQ